MSPRRTTPPLLLVGCLAALPSSAVAHGGGSETTIEGALDKEQIRTVVRANIDQIRHCYNAGLVKNPELAGRVAIQFVIRGNGKVRRSEVLESTLSDHEVAGCMAGAVKRWTFPRPSGHGKVVVTYPFVLEPG